MDDETRAQIIAAAREAVAAWPYGQRTWDIKPGHEPQTLDGAGPAQQRVVTWARQTSASGIDLCAEWIERVFAAAGLFYCEVNAQDIYERYCGLTELDQLKVGMVVAVPAHPHSMSGRSLGHVGLYVGDGLVMDCLGGRVRTAPVEAWLTIYGALCEPRWGWLFSIDLAECR